MGEVVVSDQLSVVLEGKAAAHCADKRGSELGGRRFNEGGFYAGNRIVSG
jgi:hypothetical protein